MTDKIHPSKTTYLQSALKTGLSAKAAAVYVVLLEAGPALTPKAIINRTKLHRQYVYDALRELHTKQLVLAVGTGRSIKYQAGNPQKLLQDAEKKRLDALDGVQTLLTLFDHSPSGVVEVIRGKESVVESEFELFSHSAEGGYLDIVGGAGMHFIELFKDRLEEYEACRKKKNITLRYIGTEEDVRFNQQVVIQNESRVIPGIGNIVNVAIRPESVSFYIYEDDTVVVRVKSLAAVASQRALFEVLWNVATTKEKTGQ